MKTTHTHRAHCQLCVSVQAIDPLVGFIAKHGYTVEGGWFEGVCPGSDNPNLHISRELADKHIAIARKSAKNHRKIARSYAAYKSNPSHIWNGEYKMVRKFMREEARTSWPERALYSALEQAEVTAKWEHCSDKYQIVGRQRAIDSHIEQAVRAENWASWIEAEAERVTGKIEPFLAADLKLRGFSVGDVVRIGGVKGFDAKIEAIEDKVYKINGWRNRSSVMAPHARITRPARPEKRTKAGYVMDEARPARTYWEPLRFLKKPKEPA